MASGFLFSLFYGMAFNQDGLHVDADFTKKSMMFSNNSVTTHFGYRADMEDLLQEALLTCNLLNLSSESSQKTGCPLIRQVSILSLSFLLSSCRWSEASRANLWCSFQIWESTILSDGICLSGLWNWEQGVTFVKFYMVIYSQTVTLTFTDWFGWNESFFLNKIMFLLLPGIHHLIVVTFQVSQYHGGALSWPCSSRKGPGGDNSVRECVLLQSVWALNSTGKVTIFS